MELLDLKFKDAPCTFLLMDDSQTTFQAEVERIRTLLCEMPFEDCCPLTRKFNPLPARPGIYAVRHRTQGILYLGKSGNVRGRLRGGHKALGWAFIDRMHPDDVHIAVATLSFRWTRLSLRIEQDLIRQLLPPYNERIVQED